jgi:hypothetical protein
MSYEGRKWFLRGEVREGDRLVAEARGLRIEPHAAGTGAVADPSPATLEVDVGGLVQWLSIASANSSRRGLLTPLASSQPRAPPLASWSRRRKASITPGSGMCACTS